MQQQSLNLNHAIDSLLKILNRVMGKDIHLQCDYLESQAYIMADASMMEQIVLNLVINARDAMPNGGRLYISTKRVKIDEVPAGTTSDAQAGEFIQLRVTDSGTGIAPEHLSHIFEPFFTTKEPGKGKITSNPCPREDSLQYLAVTKIVLQAQDRMRSIL